MMFMLYDILLAAKRGESESQMLLFTKFKPLLHHLAYRLHSEDAESEMTLVFFELLNKIDIKKFRLRADGVIVSYISRSIYHGYCEVVRKRGKYPIIVDIDDCDIANDMRFSYSLSIDFLLPFDDILSQREKTVLKMMFEKELKCAEIARTMGVSRQYVSKIKRQALRKVRSVCR